MNYFLFILILLILLLGMMIFLHFKKCHYNDFSFTKIETLIDEYALDSIKKIEFLLEIKKIEAETIPWFMKAISTIGIVAFFSMILATLIQTIELNNKKNELIELKKNELVILKQQKEFDNTIDILISNIEEQLIKYKIKLTKEHINIIQYKIKKLENTTTPDYYKLYRLAILINDKEKAFNAITKTDRKSKNIADIISLIEYQCYIGNKNRANSLLQKYNLETKVTKLKTSSPKWALKIYILMSFISDNRMKYISEIQFILKKTEEETKSWLNREIKRLERRNTYTNEAIRVVK